MFEGFASWLSTQPHLLTIVLTGLTDEALLTTIDCEREDAEEGQGILLRVPPALYRGVAERLASIARRLHQDVQAGWDNGSAVRGSFLGFLARRSSDEFLRAYLDVEPGLPHRLAAFKSFVEAAPEPSVLARLHQAHLLSEPVRLRAVKRMAHLAVETSDSGWIHLPAWEVLLTPGNRAQLMDTVRNMLVPRLSTGKGWLPEEREEDDPVERSLFDYQRAFEDAGDAETGSAFAEALDEFRELPIHPSEDYEPDDDWYDRGPLAPQPKSDRSIFDDIDR